MANAIVGICIDYCNSLLFVVPDTHRIQNSLANIVTQSPDTLLVLCSVTKSYMYTSIIKIVSDLNWLPFWSPIHLKINLLLTRPSSLRNLLKIRDVWYQCLHQLRSQIVECTSREYLLVFQKALKTHYFNDPPDPQNSNHDHSLSSMVIAPSG